MGVFKRYRDAQAAQKDAENAMPGAYQSNYTDRINETLDSMGAASNAGYDVGTDSELYRQYRAGAAALSGGYGSSYANSVAQQGYQQAMANVDDGLAGLRAPSFSQAPSNRRAESKVNRLFSFFISLFRINMINSFHCISLDWPSVR